MQQKLKLQSPFFRDYCGERCLSGPVKTAQVYEDKVIMRRILEEPGQVRGTEGAARIEGTVVFEMIPAKRRDSANVRIGHASGSNEVQAIKFDGSDFKYACGTVYRTARRIKAGFVYMPTG